MSRYISLVLIAIGASVLCGADTLGTRTITRPHARDGTNYWVHFTYDPQGGGSIPATQPPGQMHYPCTVTVWANGQQVGTNFSGEVTEKGCFEDKPEDMVAKALSQNLGTNDFKSLQIGGVAGTPEIRGRITSLVMTNLSLFRPYGELYIGAMPYGPTNIVISNDFKGTIQIGTNFWRVGDIGVKVAHDAIASGQVCAVRGHAVYETRHVWLTASGPVEGPAHKCAVCGRLVTQQPGEWK